MTTKPTSWTPLLAFIAVLFAASTFYLWATRPLPPIESGARDAPAGARYDNIVARPYDVGGEFEWRSMPLEHRFTVWEHYKVYAASHGISVYEFIAQNEELWFLAERGLIFYDQTYTIRVPVPAG